MIYWNCVCSHDLLKLCVQSWFTEILCGVMIYWNCVWIYDLLKLCVDLWFIEIMCGFMIYCNYVWIYDLLKLCAVMIYWNFVWIYDLLKLCVIANSNYVIMVIETVFCCNHQVHRDVLITLYIILSKQSSCKTLYTVNEVQERFSFRPEANQTKYQPKHR
jgi:hypothetical protein